MDKCKWVYRPGTNGSFWAQASCDGEYKFLSRLVNTLDNEEYGCADFYNDMICPSCHRPIEMDYSVIRNSATE